MSPSGSAVRLTETPLVTVAILAYNRRDPLRITLTKVRDELDWPSERLEIIVVDNASSDATADMVRREFPNIGLIVNEVNTGISGWNRAFEAGSGDWFLVLDDDCFVTGDALRLAVGGAEEHQADLVSFKVQSSDDKLHFFNETYDTGLLAFWGCSVLISARAIRVTGGFDAGIFMWAHEAEFVARLLDEGMCHLHLPAVVSTHMKAPASFKLAQHKRNLESLAYIVGKLLRPRDLLIAGGNLILRVLTESTRDPNIITCLPRVLAGLRNGARNRRPLRPTVSDFYRRNFIEFISPFYFARNPKQRWQERGRRGLADADVQRRRDAYWRERAAIYPQDIGSLRI